MYISKTPTEVLLKYVKSQAASDPEAQKTLHEFQTLVAQINQPEEFPAIWVNIDLTSEQKVLKTIQKLIWEGGTREITEALIYSIKSDPNQGVLIDNKIFEKLCDKITRELRKGSPESVTDLFIENIKACY